MHLHDDFRELLALLNSNGVEYVVVGGYAVAFHGAPRYTGDIEIYVRPTTENADRLKRSLDAFGFGSVGLSASDFATEHRVIQLGFEPWRVDLLTSLAGVTWDEVTGGAVDALWDVHVRVIGKPQLLQNKRAVARPQDLADVARLESHPG